MSLPRFSVKHSMFGNMLTIFVLIGGILMMTVLNRDTFPELELDLVIVTTAYPNASPEEVEDLITNPIEEELKEIENIDEMTSSSVEGISAITIQIDPDSKYKERTISEIQRKVDQVRDLPKDAEKPDVVVANANGPVIRLVVSGAVNERQLRTYGDTLKERIEAIPGVGTVVKEGWRDEEFWVEVDPKVLDDLDLALTDVSRKLATRNVNLPGGKMERDGKEVVLRTIGQFHSAEEIEEVIIRSNTDGNHVLVKDIGTVCRTFEEDSLYSRINGKRAVALQIKKKKSGDTIDIADAVKAIVVEEQARLTNGIELALVDDASFYVKRRLKVLSSNGLLGIIMVILILFLFLNFRVALITGIGIPFAILAALMIMAAMGVTINLITMFGLIIVLGMLVDDAIIVGENIYRHLEEGLSPADAAIIGTEEVMWPVVATVCTTIAAFSPLMFAPDVMGQVLRWFPIVVMITLAASLFEVLLVMPCHVVDFVPPLKKKANRAGGVTGHAWMGRLMKLYRWQIRWVLKLRYLFIVVVLAGFAALMMFALPRLKVDIFPADLIDVFQVRFDLEQGTRLADTEETIRRLEEVTYRLPDAELENVVSYVGGQINQQGGFMARGTRYGSVTIYLTPQNLRSRKTQAIIDDLRESYLGIEGIRKDNLEIEMTEPGPPTGRPLEVKIRGREFDTLQEISGKIMKFLEAYGGIHDIKQDYESGKEELHINIDFKEAARLGLAASDIAQTIFTAFQGSEATIVREGSEEIAVRVWLQKPFRDDEASLELVKVQNQTGRMIPLSRVASFERDRGLPGIFHYGGDRVVTVSASFGEGPSSMEVNRALEREFKSLPDDYPGYSLIRGGEWKETRKLGIFAGKAFLLALLMIFVILSVQFNSFFQPFIVMVSIPLGIIGVVVALIIHDKPISIMATMGMIGMAGVVVNDAIVLVKFINDQRRKEGIDTFTAIINAGEKRLRPILLTSVTTIAGLVPVIYGIWGYEPFVAPAAIALAYGLFFATFLTLMVVPCVYLIAYDLRHGFQREPTSRVPDPD